MDAYSLEDSALIEADGRGRWILGAVGGRDATGGDLSVRVQCRRSAALMATVGWRVPHERYPDDAKATVVAYLEWYLRSYLESFPVGAIHVDVTDAEWLVGRRNEPERAAFLAVHDAMSRTRLPPLHLFKPPVDDLTL